MRNKELAVRRLERLNGELKKLKNSLNLLDIQKSKEILQEIFDIHQDISDIIEREN
jgi:septation ring formation regulator EzrA